MARALLVCVSLVFFDDFALQICSILGIQVIYLCSLSFCHQYLWEQTCIKRLSIFNEVVTMVFMTLQITFSAFVTDLGVRSLIGIALLCLVNLTALVHIIVELYTVVWYIKIYCRRIIFRRRKASVANCEEKA